MFGVQVPPSVLSQKVVPMGRETRNLSRTRQRIIYKWNQLLLPSDYPIKKPLFKSPEEFKLPEYKPVNQKEKIINREYQNPVEN